MSRLRRWLIAWLERREFDVAFKRGTPCEVRTPPGGPRAVRVDDRATSTAGGSGATYYLYWQ